MTPTVFLKTIVDPTLSLMAANPAIGVPVSDKARVLVMTICGQESGWKHRRQLGVGYYPQKVGARGFPQFESVWGGPVALDDVFQKCGPKLRAICEPLDIPFDKFSVYEAIAWNDTLAIACARLNLWHDPAPLPEVGDYRGSWQYYLRRWAPGAPHPQTWGERYDASIAAMGINDH